jgi:N-acetylglutamate synthase-like GNAT family acetyltransferase
MGRIYHADMTAPVLRVRRATIEDLNALRPLWSDMHLPVAELEPRLTEFQLVEDAEGKIVGGIGFQTAAKHGRLHSEGFTDFGLADTARTLLWNRVQTLCSNHGILRLWTLEDTPFWRRLGFKPADAEELKKLPENWNAGDAAWLTLQLKDESAISAIEQELAMYMSAQKQQTERLTQRVRTLKTLATLLAVILTIFIIGAMAYLMFKRSEILPSNR